MDHLTYLSLFFTVIISGLSILFFRINNKTLKLILSFSGAYLFALSVLHLIPQIYAGGSQRIGVFILIGFFLQIFLEFMSEGIEHGHIHVHGHGEKSFPFTMMAGLCIHSFLEGMPLAGNFAGSGHQHIHHSLLIGILLHNVPIAIALMSMLLQSHIRKSNAILWLIVFALMTPLGVFISDVISKNGLGNVTAYFNYIMAVVIGIFLHISTTILFESNEQHRFNFYKLIIIILGAALALVS